MLGTGIRGYLAARMFQGCDIKRLPDALLLQDIRTEKFIRRHIGDNAPFSHHNNPIHIPVQGILQAVFDDEYGFSRGPADFVSQIDSLFPGSRVQVGQRFIK